MTHNANENIKSNGGGKLRHKKSVDIILSNDSHNNEYVTNSPLFQNID